MNKTALGRFCSYYVVEEYALCDIIIKNDWEEFYVLY